jgi:CRISPR-associated protein Cas2
MRGEFYIICYDTPSDKRRRKLYKLLKNYAVSVQKSVFETFLDEEAFAAMMRKIENLMDSSSDSVRVYGMSRRAQKQMKVIGFPGKLIDPDHYYLSGKEEVQAAINEDDSDLPDWL